MFFFQSLLWKFSLKLCFRLLSTHFRLRLEPGRADSGRSYQSKRPTALKATDYLCGLFIAAPGRAHSLGGESPLHTRQGEVLAEQQGCPPRGRIRVRPPACRLKIF